MKNIFANFFLIPLCLVFAMLLLLSANNNAVAQNTRLSPEQNETMRQLIAQGYGRLCGGDRFEDAIKDIDPILVGRNVVFSNNWLRHIGLNNRLTRQQFERWRIMADEIYDCYEKLTGRPPKYGKKVFIDVNRFDGWAHAHSNRVCFSEEALIRDGAKQIREGSTWAMCHELGHIFSFGKDWEIEPEVAAHFLHFYWYETTGRRYSGLGAKIRREHTERAWRAYHETKRRNAKMPTLLTVVGMMRIVVFLWV